MEGPRDNRSTREVSMEPIRLAFLGAGRRTTYLYRRLIEEMSSEVALVGAATVNKRLRAAQRETRPGEPSV